MSNFYRFILPLVFGAVLIFGSIFFVRTTPAEVAPDCITVEAVLEVIKTENIQVDTLVLKGERLKRFTDNYEAKFGQPHPEISALMIMMFNSEDWRALLFSAENGCLLAPPFTVNIEIINQLMHGRSATN
jgi:hypothetical protein